MKWLIIIPFLLLLFNIGYKFVEYKYFISHNQFIKAKIISQYKKHNYWVLKLKNNKIEFYTTTKDDLKDILNYQVETHIITKNISFLDYLTKFYAPTFRLGLLPLPKYKQFISSQHKNKYISNIFNALFFGDSLYYETRKKLSTLGISHLFALSGLHLAIISGFLYLIFTPIYNKLMPSYRNRNIDLGIFILIVLFGYLYFVNFPPSLVRSFLMELIVFLLAFHLRDIFNIKVLLYTIIFSIVLFPNFIINIGFFLSVMGVLFIFIFFEFTKSSKIAFILPFYLYIAMFIIVHYFFGNFNYYQFLSPFISIIFTIFYPLEIILHIFGYGGVLDNLIESYLNLGKESIMIYTPTWLFISYLVIIALIIKKVYFYNPQN